MQPRGLDSASDALPTPARRLSFALGCVLVATAIRYALNPVLGLQAPFILQGFAVALAALYGGVIAGLAGTAVAVLFCGFLFVRPVTLGFIPTEVDDAVGLAVFAVLGICLSIFGERFVQTKRQRLAAEARNAYQTRINEELRKSHEALANKEAQQRAIFEALDVAVVILDPAGSIVDVNEHFLKLHGVRSREELAASTRTGKWPEICRLYDLDGALIPVENWPTSRMFRSEAVHNLEMTARTISTDRQWQGLWCGSWGYDANGNRTVMVLTVIDITDLRKAQQELRVLKGLLSTCSHCKRIRDREGHWHDLEKYITDHSEARFSHGLCPDCLADYYPEFHSNP
ncbi:MAG TPA: DUF4118 domain-containing protein [Bryobacteraceae bacterium]|nr:DUF4118 domain-containing protein [Bryobacteraceae bacterium]